MAVLSTPGLAFAGAMVSGQVTDAKTGQPLSDAVVTVGAVAVKGELNGLFQMLPTWRILLRR